MATFDLTKPVKNNLRGDDTAKFRMANDAARDALITGDLIKLGHIIYHEADGKHYKLKTYPTFGILTGVVWDELGGSPLNNTLTSDSTTEALTAAQGKALKTLVDSKQAKTTTAIATGGIDLNNTYNNKIVTIDLATDFVTINETNITDAVFQVQITTKAIGAEVRFTGDSANLEYNSLTDNKIVFTDRNMSVFVFKNDNGKFCWRVVGSTLPVQITSENIIDIVTNAGFSSYPKPYFNNLYPLSIPPTQSRTITINGAFFKEPVENMLARFIRYSEEPLLDVNGLPIHDETKVIRELQVNSLTFVNDSVMEVNVTGVNIHDTATNGTGAFELDGTTEINNVYWLFLHNGATRIFKNEFTVSSGDIYIPRAGLTTDIPEGDWSDVTGVVDITEGGSVRLISSESTGTASIKEDGIALPMDKDWSVKWSIDISQFRNVIGGYSDLRGMCLQICRDSDDVPVMGMVWLKNNTEDKFYFTEGTTGVVGGIQSPSSPTDQDNAYPLLTSRVFEYRRDNGVFQFKYGGYLLQAANQSNVQKYIKAISTKVDLVNISVTIKD
ncbi:hypothetical protein FHR24_001512 [Wenyingzhuangia heitensis]|uniref:Tail fiber protein n=1 Tax=Wenyingzhuangia heitensis TaxID=1487859 RepID=A0ABX0U8A4_9FLAO|nr:hypothetical protein [Wenyingzhuangia heitensis]NIJ45073.1 hypothetical protein [Wenyingzhuangia heitensis]